MAKSEKIIGSRLFKIQESMKKGKKNSAIPWIPTKSIKWRRKGN